MKALRIVLTIFGILFILINVLGYFGSAGPKEADIPSLVGWYIGKHLLFVIGGLLLWWANRIKKKSKRHDVESLVDSLPG